MMRNYKHKKSYAKIRFCGKQAAKNDLRYFWVDTCCIDKSSSAELTEALNSMFRWYQNADRCYVFLADVSVSSFVEGGDFAQRWKPAFRRSRWFTRGWTLQELIAPASVEFFSQDEQLLGTKHSLEPTLHEITGIATRALRGSVLSEFSLDERMSWADKRNTKREEDKAYSLLGIFNVYMPLIYGEGQRNALLRLHKTAAESSNTGIPSLPPTVFTGLPNVTNRVTIDTGDGIGEDEARKRKELLDLLFFDNIDERLLSLKAAHNRTCKWFLQKDLYKAWMSPENLRDHRGFLWIKGKPGAGKSTLMKFLDSKAKNSAKSDPNALVASFFFNARGEQLERCTTGVYRSLLWQLFEKAPDLQEILGEFDTNTRRIIQSKGWQQEILKETLGDVVERLGCRTLQIFIDALDECDDEDVADMISFLEDIGEQAVEANVHLHICFSSRHYPTIVIRRGKQIVLEDETEHDDDIIRYIDAKLKLANPKKAENLKAQILEKSAGVFLWVALVIPILNKTSAKGRAGELQKCLKEIPPKLDDLFEMILKRDQEDMKDLQLCIQWILFAKRPLKQEEYFFALRHPLPESTRQLSEEPSADEMHHFVHSSSKGLAQVTKTRSKEKTPTVQFIHESVRDFFLLKNGYLRLWPELSDHFITYSHERLRDRCSTPWQVLFDASSHHFLDMNLPVANSEEAAALRHSLSKKYPFIKYAVDSVLYHANAFEDNVEAQEIFLERFPFDHWRFLNNALEQFQIRRYTSHSSLLYILADKGLPRLIRQELRRLPTMDISGERHYLPIWAACTNSNRDAILAFLLPETVPQIDQRLATHVDTLCGIKPLKDHTLLSYAVEKGDEVLVKLLLETGKVDVNHKSQGQTLLLKAMTMNCEAIVQLLLETGEVDVESGDAKGFTPLLFAVAQGRQADVNHASLTLEAPLHRAVSRNHETIVKLLLDTGKVAMNYRDGGGATALIMAARGGHEKANVNLADWFRRTPLLLAAENGHELVVKLLLNTGRANINQGDDQERTPLFMAAENGHELVVKLLLDTAQANANVNKVDYCGRNPLSIAAERGHEAIANLLQSYGGRR
ncbi:ankyrin [Amniculicola lignicola CBS 123094]|uniref:Ankyrin n=1 Tax=Amniculicola lignicola CBS 123094 TaxID=1392246 RepID=A0A6A5WB42_9PLEO|nr:ankyrin [Amniculicola lignicola CBS 123094]